MNENHFWKMRVPFLLVLICAAVLFTAEVHAQTNKPSPIVGAIRWDAWSGGAVTAQVERTLGSEKYRDRLPWFATVVDDKTVSIVGGNQKTMDEEIRFAADAGLNYWAFVMYPEQDSMSNGIQLYLESTRSNEIKFSVILHNNLGVRDESWTHERERLVKMFKDPRYQTVLDGRPLVYLFQANIERFKELREAVAKEGINPYYVYMGWDVSKDYATQKPNGFDAVSSYATGAQVKTFAELVQDIERQGWQSWRRAAEAGIRYIPLVTTGWDKEPRKENPVSWELDHDYHKQPFFPSQAKPDEIVQHLQHALEFVDSHPDVCESRAIIVYAWNEHDEGGWLAPTWQKDGCADNRRLEAIRSVLRPKESILTYPIPWKSEPRARLYTDILYENDFSLDAPNLLSRYFTGGDSALFEDFKREFYKEEYTRMQAKPDIDSMFEGHNCTIHTYYKPFTFYQSKFLDWIQKHRGIADFLPANARKCNDYRGDLVNPILPSESQVETFDLKKSFGKRISFGDGKVLYLQDNRLNPYRWWAPNNTLLHHETPAIFMENNVSPENIVRMRKMLDDYLIGTDRTRKILLKYRAKIRVEDYREQMGEKTIFDMYKDGEFENGTDLLTTLHREWTARSESDTYEGRWSKHYMNYRLEKPFVQVSVCVNMYMADGRYLLQEFMLFNKDYVSSTKGFYCPVNNPIMDDYIYEGGCSGLVGWNRLSVDALRIDRVSCSREFPVILNGGEYIDVSGDNSPVIERSVEGVIDLTNYYVMARRNNFFPGEEGFYVNNDITHGFGTEGKPESNQEVKPSIYWAGFMFEMTGAYKLEIEIEEFDVVVDLFSNLRWTEQQISIAALYRNRYPLSSPVFSPFLQC